MLRCNLKRKQLSIGDKETLIKTLGILRGHKHPGSLPWSQLLTREHFPVSLQLQVNAVIEINTSKKLEIGTNQELILRGEWENLKFSNIHKASNRSFIIFLKGKMISQPNSLVFMQFTGEISLVCIGGSKVWNLTVWKISYGWNG